MSSVLRSGGQPTTAQLPAQHVGSPWRCGSQDRFVRAGREEVRVELGQEFLVSDRGLAALAALATGNWVRWGLKMEACESYLGYQIPPGVCVASADVAV